KLIVALTGTGRGQLPAARRAAWASIGMLGLFAVGALLVRKLPVVWLLGGFWIPFAVIVLKAASLLLIPTTLWKRLTGGRWGAALAVVALVAGAWLATGSWTGASHRGATGTRAPIARLAQAGGSASSGAGRASAPA